MRECARAAVGIALALSLMAGNIAVGPALGTTLGPLRSDRSGEILEPSAIRPSIPPPSSSTDDLAGLRALPAPSFEVYERLGAAIARARGGPRVRQGAGPSAEGFSGLHENLTALEWIQLWSDNGYWLENDQWSDFQAIAIASYLPDLQYWLGRDRWAAFGSGILGAGGNSKYAGSPTGETNGAMSPGAPAFGYATGPDGIPAGDGSRDKIKPDIEPKTFEELLISMMKKIARQPLFYLAIAGVVGVLLIALRRQSTWSEVRR